MVEYLQSDFETEEQKEKHKDYMGKELHECLYGCGRPIGGMSFMR